MGCISANVCDQLALQLFGLVDRLYNRLHTLFVRHSSDLVSRLVRIPDKRPESPIFALYTPFPRNLAQYCQQAGFVVRAVVPPTVPKGTERVRICLHAGNTQEQVDNFVRLVKNWVDSNADKATRQSRALEGPKL